MDFEGRVVELIELHSARLTNHVETTPRHLDKLGVPMLGVPMLDDPMLGDQCLFLLA